MSLLGPSSVESSRPRTGGQPEPPPVEKARRAAAVIRAVSLEMVLDAGYGFPGSCMSLADLLGVLYTRWTVVGGEGPDRVCLSKGHAAPALYAAELGLGWQDHGRYAHPGSLLQGHPRADVWSALAATSGPLGLAIGHALGRHVAAGALGQPARLAVLVGDGELQTGAALEAVSWLAESETRGVCVMVDANGWQSTGMAHTRPLQALRAIFDQVHELDGNDVAAVHEVVAGLAPTTKPSLLIAHTRRWAGTPWADRPPASMREMPSDDVVRCWIEDLLSSTGGEATC